MLARIRQLASEHVDFAFETTLATRSFGPWLASLAAHRYEIHLVFLWLPSPEVAIARVAQRVKQGGHHVPDETVRRRYWAGLRNFFGIYQPLAASWQMVDNSRRRMRPIAAGRGRELMETNDADAWDRVKAAL
ncbi:MAG: hypothetical protein HYX69_08120 [Planctomycetia bacterium]|nr:hypothetical protein [Planctomycetia bacterium]